MSAWAECGVAGLPVEVAGSAWPLLWGLLVELPLQELFLGPSLVSENGIGYNL